MRESITDVFETIDRWAPDLVLMGGMGSDGSESASRLRERLESERPLLPLLLLSEEQRKDVVGGALAEEIRRRCRTHDPV